MKKVYVELDKSTFQNIKDFLLQDGMEHAVFLLGKPRNDGIKTTFKIENYYLVPDEGMDHSSYDLRLGEDTQAKIIKWAWDNQGCLVEIHSHPFSKTGASFSSYDLDGFKEFVPHVWWRLKGKPYLAFVFGQTDFDALAWLDNPNAPQPIEGIIVDGDCLKPTNKGVLWFKN